MNPKDAGEFTWLQAQIANQKLKQNAQTQDVDGMQALSVLYILIRVRGYISAIIYFIGGDEASSPLPPHVSAEALTLYIKHFKTKIV